MTKVETGIDCSLVRDLLIPYAAGDISQPSREWVDHHMGECDDCREAFAAVMGDQTTSILPPPAAVPDKGSRVVRRIRVTAWVVFGVVVVLLLAVGGLTWTIGAMMRLAEMPSVHQVPRAGVTALEAVGVDLSPLGFHRSVAEKEKVISEGFQEGASAQFQDALGRQVAITAYRFTDARSAARFESDWEESLGTKMLSVTSRTMEKGAAKFRSGGKYYYTWFNGGWLITIAVPGEINEPARVRDQIRDLFFIFHTR